MLLLCDKHSKDGFYVLFDNYKECPLCKAKEKIAEMEVDAREAHRVQECEVADLERKIEVLTEEINKKEREWEQKEYELNIKLKGRSDTIRTLSKTLLNIKKMC